MTGSGSGSASGSSGVDSSGVSGTYSGASYPPATGDWAYPFDQTGVAITNKITGEIQTVSLNAAADFNWIIPLSAPYFRSTMVIVDNSTGRTLQEGIDYICTHKFIDATTSIGIAVYGSITFLNLNFAGVVALSYQTIGGAWVVPENQLAAMLANLTSNPATTTWDEVADLPYQFPPINHEFNLIDLKGMESVITAIEGLASAVTGAVASGVNSTSIPGNSLVAADIIAILCEDNLNYYIYQLTESPTPFTIDVPILSVGQVRRIEIALIQTVEGGSTMDWPDNITWASGGTGDVSGPDLSTTLGVFDVIVLVYANPQQGWLGYIAS